MRHRRFSRWVAVLALVIAPATTPVTAEETATITITGTFKMDALWETVGADLAGAFANGSEHTWTATLHGVTHAHSRNSNWASTLVYATSFEFEFSGPDAATLNAVVGDQLGGSGASLRLDNYYSAGIHWASAWYLALPSADPDAGVSFYAFDDLPSDQVQGIGNFFSSDADGYPVLPSQLFTFGSYVSEGSGSLVSYYDTLDVTGDIGSPTPATLSIGDAAIAEGDRGSRQLTLWVTLSNTSDQTVTVDYSTVDGTAVSVGGKGRNKSDYGAASGTLTFQPGEIAKAITISIQADRNREAHETFTVELSNAVGTTIEDGVATATIVNDD